MNANFLTLLFCITLITGLISLVDIIFWQPRRKLATITKQPMVVECSRSFFPVLLLVLVIRSFVGQLFVVPTGSLEPTIMPKAYILVNQFAYGLRLPVWEKKIIPIGQPRHGDIVLFHSPVQPHKDLIKRLIGLPGDHISYINKVLYINGKKAPQKFIRYTTDTDENHSGNGWAVKVMQENLLGVKHNIYVCANDNNCPGVPGNNFHDIVVPEGEYFMMGDNRDDSDDGRFWGFVPENNIMGKGWLVLLSWNRQTSSIRWHQSWKRL